MRGCVPRDRSLLGISPTDENGTFDVLVATFENDWIIGRFVAVDDEFLVISIAEVRNLGRFDVVLPLQRYGSPERNVPGSVPCNVARGDLPRTVVVQFPFRGVDDRAVAAQRHVALANGSRVDRPAGYAVARTQLCHAVPCTVRGIEPEVRVAVVVELHPLPASDTRIGPVHRDASVAAVYRDMRGSEGRSPDHPAADFSFGEGTAQAVDIVRVDDGGPDAGGIELRGRYTACRYAVGGDGSCGNLRGGDTAGIDSVGRDLRQLGIAAAAQSRGEGADRCRPQGTDRRGERDVARSVPRDVAARDRSGSRGIQPPFIAPDTVRAERNATCGRGAAPHSVVLRTPVKGVGIHRPAADFPFCNVQGQSFDVSGGNQGGFQRRRVDACRSDNPRCDLGSTDGNRLNRIGRECSGKDAVLVDVGRTDPVQTHSAAELDLACRGVIPDILVAITQLGVTAVIYIEGFVAIPKSIDAVYRLCGDRSRGGLRIECKRAYGYPGDGAVAVFRARKEFGGDDRVAVDERLTRIPLLDPVEHVGIDPVLARDTRLGFRPDERQMIDNTGNCHGNIYCSVVGEGRRTGGDNVG